MASGQLLDIAIREFASKGLDGASTRGIAAAAGTAMSSITYHYGGKQGLYLAAADQIAAEMDDVVAGHDIDAIKVSEDAAAARATIKSILARMVDKMARRDEENATLFIVREQMQPTEAFDRIYDGAMGRMFDGLAELTCVATRARDPIAARVTVLTLFGQVVMLRAGRATCRRLLGAPIDQPALIAEFHHRIASNIDAILDTMTIEQGRT